MITAGRALPNLLWKQRTNSVNANVLSSGAILRTNSTFLTKSCLCSVQLCYVVVVINSTAFWSHYWAFKYLVWLNSSCGFTVWMCSDKLIAKKFQVLSTAYINLQILKASDCLFNGLIYFYFSIKLCNIQSLSILNPLCFTFFQKDTSELSNAGLSVFYTLQFKLKFVFLSGPEHLPGSSTWPWAHQHHGIRARKQYNDGSAGGKRHGR